MDHQHMNNAYPSPQYGGMTQGQSAGMGQQASYGATMSGQAYGMAQPYPPMYAAYMPQQNTSLFNDRFLKGLLIGGAAAYLLSNETVQRTAIRGAVRAWSLLQGGVEELKERFHDAEAELRAEAGE